MRVRSLMTAGSLGLAVGGVGFVTSCKPDETLNPTLTGANFKKDDNNGDHLVFADRSETPALVKNVMAGVGVYTLLSSDDKLAKSPDFVFGGSTDGAGLWRNPDDTYTLLVNNEDNFAVSRLTLDKHFRPVSGEYVVNSDNGTARLCSATLATPAEHGFGPVFLTAGESSVESMIRAVNPLGSKNSSQAVTAFGRWSAEQALPLPATAFPGRTVVVIGDDDSGASGGQVALYVGNSIGDLDGGKLFVMARANDDTRETNLTVGNSYPVVFKQIPNQKTLTGAQINAQATTLKALVFGRVEDVDYRRGGSGRELYFVVTGQNTTGVNADKSRAKYGRIYKLTLDAADPTQGSLELLLDGDDRTGPAKTFENPDNIVATTNYLYVMEDPNGYGDETHDSYLYQFNLATKQLKVVLELDHRRDKPDAAKYNVGGLSKLGDWEGSGMIDISDETDEPGTFLFGVQAHTWTGEQYRNPDKGTIRVNESQASQLLLLRNLPR